MQPGKFITLEGGEGVGKTTNLAFIEEFLSRRGVPYRRTREPGGTPLGEEIRKLLLGFEGIAPDAELLLVFAARAQHLRELIRPALAEGLWVVSDRFTDASHAYQGGGRGLQAGIIDQLETWLHDDLQPDLTLWLDAPVQLGMARVRQRGPSDRFETEADPFFDRVRAAYRQRAERYPERIRRIDASRGLPEIQADIAGHLEGLFR